MEKKTIGAFIAALRKARGMTQKDLAERLHVSDKTVSRWERDENDPDLALIPVLAEIFEVTCDELLRGERRSAQEMQEGEASPKGEKQRHRLLKLTLSRYQDQTFIAMGISAAGVAVAMIANTAFLRGSLGFLLGTVFYIISIVLQSVWKNQTVLAVEDSGISERELSDFRRQVIRLTQGSTGFTIACLGFACPLLLAGAYEGLPLMLSAVLGIGTMLLALTIYGAVCWFQNARDIRLEVYHLEEKEEAAYWHNHSLKKQCFCRVAAVLAVTLAFHAFGFEMIWNQGSLVKGHRFEDYDSFVAFMEEDIQESIITTNGLFSSSTEHVLAPQPAAAMYDENGNAILEAEAPKHTVEDANGNVVCTYDWRNATVSTIRPTPEEGTALPIIVTTHAQQAIARNMSSLITGGYCVLYPLEVLAAFLIYFKKRMK